MSSASLSLLRRVIRLCCGCCALAGVSAIALVAIWGPFGEFPFRTWALITAAQIMPLVVISVLSKQSNDQVGRTEV